MSRFVRMLTAIASIALLGLFIVPVWRIELAAPQYPEGLGMRIGISSIRGEKPNDIDNINGLNHYIGMKHITPSAIPELRIIPWVVGGLVLFGLIAAGTGSTKVLYAWVGTLAAAGVGGLVDFWKWEFDYGHSIDYAHAIIKIPGMNYQPPLIGVKQMLNITTVSWPDVGGWIALAAFVLGAMAVVITFRSRPHAHAL
jgi:copper chaperone NosL